MCRQRGSGRTGCGYLLAAGLLVLLAHGGPVRAEQPAGALPPTVPAAATTTDLDACRHLALEKQPAMAAARASLAAAQAKVQALQNLHVPALIRPDLPIRRKQACIGLSVAQAQYSVQEWETIYAVTRTYLTVLYAREQAKVARELLQNLGNLQDTTKELAGQKESNVSVIQFDRIRVLRELALGRQQEAGGGVERALAALREAMGVCADFPLLIPDVQFQANVPVLAKDQVVALALERRGELGQTTGAAEVAALEVKAQAVSRGRTAQTFAAGADIHAQSVPQGLRNGDYRPGGIGLDYPVQLVGSCADRVKQAEALGARADAVAEKTRNLVVLEAEDTYYRFLDWSSRAPRLREAATLADKRSESVRGLFDPRVAKPRATLDEVMEASLLATQFRIQANEAEFRYLLILADLERVTAGGICPSYQSSASPAMP